MKSGANVLVAAAARLYVPLIMLFALAMFQDRPPGSGVGFVAGAAFGLALMLHALVFGAQSARQAFPPVFGRLVLAAGIIAVAAGAGLARFAYAPLLIEGGLFAITCAGAALVVLAVFGRAATLRGAA
jgi:multisubunit Na+/H+ antiporter MnhB subunit